MGHPAGSAICFNQASLPLELAGFLPKELFASWLLTSGQCREVPEKQPGSKDGPHCIPILVSSKGWGLDLPWLQGSCRAELVTEVQSAWLDAGKSAQLFLWPVVLKPPICGLWLVSGTSVDGLKPHL